MNERPSISNYHHSALLVFNVDMIITNIAWLCVQRRIIIVRRRKHNLSFQHICFVELHSTCTVSALHYTRRFAKIETSEI